MNLNILAIGASKNIGYLACLRLLAEGHTVTYLLRKPEIFDKDAKIQEYIKEGKVKCIKGDATVRADVQRGFDEAIHMDSKGKLDFVLFSVGGYPSGFSPTKGFVLDPPNICSSSILNVLAAFPDDSPSSPQPKLIAISSHGLTKASHSTLPLLIKPMFSYLLQGPHADKLVMERAIFHAADWTWTDGEPKETAKFLGAEWQDQMRKPGYLKNVTIIRPSLLNDGDDKPAKGIYRATTDKLPGAYSINRKEVAHFVVEGVIKKDEWKGKVINLSV